MIPQLPSQSFNSLFLMSFILVFRIIFDGYRGHFLLVHLPGHSPNDSWAHFWSHPTPGRGRNYDWFAGTRQRRVGKNSSFHILAQWVKAISSTNTNYQVILVLKNKSIKNYDILHRNSDLKSKWLPFLCVWKIYDSEIGTHPLN